MIYKRCGYCGKRIPSGTSCNCVKERIIRNAKRTDGVRKEYESTRWRKLRRICLERYHWVDIYALFHDNRILPAEVVHHIEPALERPELFFSEENYIPVSADSHREIHERYKNEDASEVKAELRRYLARYKDQGAGKKV